VEKLNFSLWISLVWFLFLIYVVFINGKEIAKGKISFDGFWIAFFAPSIVMILLEYLIKR